MTEMTTSCPLVGQHVRLDGGNSGTEGVVLGVRFDGLAIVLMLKRTKHPILPPERDGAYPIVFILVDPKRGDMIYIMPNCMHCQRLMPGPNHSRMCPFNRNKHGEYLPCEAKP